MNLGILLSRRTYLKTFGPVMVEALARGHTVTAILDYDGKRGEAIQAHDLAPYPGLQRWDAHLRGLSMPTLDVLLGQQYKLPAYACPYVYVGQYYDNLAMEPPTTYTMLYHSDYHWKLHYSMWRMDGTPQPVVGWLAGDHVRKLWPKTLLQELYRVPTERPAWVLFPPKAPTLEYRTIIRALIERAKKENAFLVVKYRLKTYRPWFAYFVGDRRVWDDVMYPHTSMALNFVASKVIHFDSGAGYEAAYCGTYAVSIALEVPPAWLTSWVEYSHQPYSRLQWPGVNVGIQAKDAAEFLRHEDWVSRQVDKDAREAFVKKFLGYDDHRSAARVMDYLEHGTVG